MNLVTRLSQVPAAQTRSSRGARMRCIIQHVHMYGPGFHSYHMRSEVKTIEIDGRSRPRQVDTVNQAALLLM
eukprot:975437-Amphidinium_carterae.2